MITSEKQITESQIDSSYGGNKQKFNQVVKTNTKILEATESDYENESQSVSSKYVDLKMAVDVHPEL